MGSAFFSLCVGDRYVRIYVCKCPCVNVSPFFFFGGGGGQAVTYVHGARSRHLVMAQQKEIRRYMMEGQTGRLLSSTYR